MASGSPNALPNDATYYAALNNSELEALRSSPDEGISLMVENEIALRNNFLREHEEERLTDNLPPFTMYYFIQNQEGEWVRTVSVATEARDGEDTCIVCLDNTPDCRFTNCSHSKAGYICCFCADRLLARQGGGRCPLCRGDISHYEAFQLPAIQERDEF
jgi:hypothetical protein